MHTNYNESTAGADASVEVPKLHNIKLLIASFFIHTLIIIIMITSLILLHAINRIVGNDQP